MLAQYDWFGEYKRWFLVSTCKWSAAPGVLVKNKLTSWDHWKASSVRHCGQVCWDGQYYYKRSRSVESGDPGEWVYVFGVCWPLLVGQKKLWSHPTRKCGVRAVAKESRSTGRRKRAVCAAKCAKKKWLTSTEVRTGQQEMCVQMWAEAMPCMWMGDEQRRRWCASNVDKRVAFIEKGSYRIRRMYT